MFKFYFPRALNNYCLLLLAGLLTYSVFKRPSHLFSYQLSVINFSLFYCYLFAVYDSGVENV